MPRAGSGPLAPLAREDTGVGHRVAQGGDAADGSTRRFCCSVLNERPHDRPVGAQRRRYLPRLPLGLSFLASQVQRDERKPAWLVRSRGRGKLSQLG